MELKRAPRPVYLLKKLTNSPYKYQVITPHHKTIKFGASKYEDYTMHHDSYRKQLYILRHQKRENHHDINTKGFWSRWLLWNKKSIRASIQDIQTKFNVKIKII